MGQAGANTFKEPAISLGLSNFLVRKGLYILLLRYLIEQIVKIFLGLSSSWNVSFFPEISKECWSDRSFLVVVINGAVVWCVLCLKLPRWSVVSVMEG